MDNNDLMIQEKIKKREKTDIMLAYILIVILVGCILFVLYLKFIKNDDDEDVIPEEHIVERITLSSIASSINSSLNSKYDGISAADNEDSIDIKYGELSYNIKLINNELEFNIDNDNKELSEDIYKEIVISICNYYNDNADGCKRVSNNIKYGEDITGIRFVNDIIYINVTNSVTPSDITSYVEETITDIDNTNYELSMNDINVSNIKVDEGDVSVTISGNISKEGNVTVKLYNSDSELLEEKSATGNENFSITFDYDDKLNIDSIKKYSISIE